jgi:hypothetical protein
VLVGGSDVTHCNIIAMFKSCYKRRSPTNASVIGVLTCRLAPDIAAAAEVKLPAVDGATE